MTSINEMLNMQVTFGHLWLILFLYVTGRMIIVIIEAKIEKNRKLRAHAAARGVNIR